VSDLDATRPAHGSTRKRPAARAVPPPKTTIDDAMVDPRRAVELEEHRAAVSRLSTVGLLGVVAWLAFGVIDVVVIHFIEPGRLWHFWGPRLLASVVLAAWIWRIRRPPLISPLAGRVGALIFFGTASVALTFICIEYRGIASPYFAGILLILLVHGVALPDHWKVGMYMLGVPALAHPVVLLACAPFSSAIRAQLHDSRALAAFGHNLFFIFSAWLLLVIGGHVYWTLRRQLFEARSIGRYTLKRCIGIGGMGEVWAAYHGGLHQDVALKILRPGEASQAAVARFEREVRATGELRHPNTVRVFDFGVTPDGLWYYAMELLDGEELFQLVDRDGPVAPTRAAHLIGQVARALAEAHAHGIVHRDIKPQNLFLCSLGGEKDVVKVLDFGIARLLRGEDQILTQEGGLVGSPQFISPEAARGEPADARSDVYGVGAVLYYLLTATPPFVHDSVGEVLNAHKNELPESPSSRLGSPIPAGLEALCLRCLEKDPEKRYATAAELAQALAALR
jgi:eukaryotic-like serine/threonine-protein kinase